MKAAGLLLLISISVGTGYGLTEGHHNEPNWRAAASYLDQRQEAWFGWSQANRDNNTSCIACHTGVPFAMVRSTLRTRLAEQTPGSAETRLLNNVKDRVAAWDDLTLYYESKTEQSRGTESVINALILAFHEQDQELMSEPATQAMEHLWREQIADGDHKGGWHWLQFGSETDFEPWESTSAEVYGTALAAIAVGKAPGNYRNTASIATNVNNLRERLSSDFADTSHHNQLYILWADKTLGEILDDDQRQTLIESIRNLQNEDGGWSIATLGNYRRTDDTDLNFDSDGYATGLVTTVLHAAGIPRDDEKVRQALQWLLENQNAESGWWAGNSVHRQRDPDTHKGQFVRDAATAFALMGINAYD